MKINNKEYTLNSHGFTLIEIMIAMVVFSIGLLAIVTMQINAISGNTSAFEMTQATSLAQDKVEELMAMNYLYQDLNDTDGDGNNGGGLNDTGANADFSIAQGMYTVNWNIATDFPIDSTKSIRVIVTWANSKSLSLDTIIFDQI